MSVCSEPPMVPGRKEDGRARVGGVRLPRTQCHQSATASGTMLMPKLPLALQLLLPAQKASVALGPALVPLLSTRSARTMRPRKAFAILLPFCASAATISLGAPSPRSSADVSAQASSDSLRPALRLLSRHGGHHSVDAGEDDKGDRAAFGMSMSATNSTVGAHNLTEALAEHADTHSEASTSAEAEHGGHEHHHSHAPALLELNETKILDSHAPNPPSYWDYDHGEDGKPALLYVHIALMTVAYFGLLPLGPSTADPRPRAPSSVFADRTSAFRGHSTFPEGWAVRFARDRTSGIPRNCPHRLVLRPGTDLPPRQVPMIARRAKDFR